MPRLVKGGVLLALAAALCVSSSPLYAQGVSPFAQLNGRVSEPLRAQVSALADSMLRAGLPVGPVIDKTLEGVSKGADDQRIMIAVRMVAADLVVARRALGPASDNEMTAAIAALRAGSSPAQLTELRRSLPGRPLVVPLAVLASLLVDGAPAPSAVVAVVTNARRRGDADLLAYGRGVSHDIASGIAPLIAMSGNRSPATAASLPAQGMPTQTPLPPSPPARHRP